jgi:hypothetical protein
MIYQRLAKMFLICSKSPFLLSGGFRFGPGAPSDGNYRIKLTSLIATCRRNN